MENMETKKRNKRGYWNVETLKADALKYETRGAWSKGNASAYLTARRLNLLDEVTSHMKKKSKEPQNQVAVAVQKVDSAVAE